MDSKGKQQGKARSAKDLVPTVPKLRSLLKKYKQTKKVQTGLLKLSELCSTETDMVCLYRNLQKIIREYFPAENLYIERFDGKGNDPYYINELFCAPIKPQLHRDIIDFISAIAKPVYLNHDQVVILETDDEIVKRPFPVRNDKTKLVDVWLMAPLMVGTNAFGLVAIKGFINDSQDALEELHLIRFIARQISACIQRFQAINQLQSYSQDINELVGERTADLQQTNLRLRKQVEERRAIEEQLYFAAHHDTLTKLPNRAMFSDRLEHSLKHVKRHPNHRFAVLFIDLDRFKVINDTLGHHIGDLLLIEIAERIADCIRGNDILARLGGDEFVILLDTLVQHEDAEDIAQRIIETIENPFDIDNQELYSSASIGITVCDRRYQNAAEVLRDADAAMYQAKALGKGRFIFFDDSMREQLMANLNLEHELRKALREQEFTLHFQKITDLSHDQENPQTLGFETLLRWQHPKRGLLSPGAFLEVAEESGLIIDIECWVLASVAEQLQRWDHEGSHSNTFVSVNLSPKQLHHKTQVKQLIEVIHQHFPSPERLILEFNERAFVQNPEQSLQALKTLKTAGVKLALDDYGHGISSLNYLSNYPFAFIKLHQSFVKSLNNNEKNLTLAKSLHELGDSFGFRLVAEGVETQAQLDLVKKAGCDYAQGYFISRPQAADLPKEVNSDSDDDVIDCA
ncbi:EAL domain-containing protein [Thalassotalea litorea]|uniref:EAL domain-containing protein n=1 Tax=Thalassotalea litorea TaxID=2020715 RepID=A0A5R9IJC1_9GAMM|nr:EAL domain-containing protein [Thalassotalea litorea]TLU64573.1 EAL domain-containing protein [Thalassotalea litorea]